MSLRPLFDVAASPLDAATTARMDGDENSRTWGREDGTDRQGWTGNTRRRH
ncbi:hypothetical protein [Saccharothrix obliqua]|uniref:hypothetical protein n=1 Tax=Saccharothrix obliqua TaxID=2861747 RepID=UPI001C5FBACA|nr:hypothetical protein [Saccharothrix obliqua]MBW4718834.1 hypothetical protein [Saccharothrix obliqua]